MTKDTRTITDPFTGKDVQIRDKLTDRLRGRYASGPILPNGVPALGWSEFKTPPIQHEAAAYIEQLQAELNDTVICLENERKRFMELLK